MTLDAVTTPVESAVGGHHAGGLPQDSLPRWRRWGRILVPIVLFVLAALGPSFINEQFRLSVLTIVFLNASLAAGLVISLGYTGLLNLSQGTFYGIGAYTTAILVAEHDVPLELALPVAGIGGAIGALLLGLTSLRVRGDYFALVSLAFTIAAVQVMENWTSVTKGREGYFGIPQLSLFGHEIDSTEMTYYACLGLLVFTWLVVVRFVSTFAARAMLAVRYDEIAAAMMGINVRFTKLLAMAMSGFLAGIAGSFLVVTLLFVKPSNFDLISSFNIMLWVIIGGMASLPGAIIVAGGLTMLIEEFREIYQYRVGIVGAVVLIAVFYRGGVFGDWIARIRGRRRDRREVVDAAV